MPKIAVDEFGLKKIRPILGGRASIICYEKEPEIWHYRQLKLGTKLYYYRKLNEIDSYIASRKAEDLYFEFLDKETPSKSLIKDLIDKWINIKEKRQLSGQITIATVRGVRTSLRSVIQLYLTQEKKLTRICEIETDTFLDFYEWRINSSLQNIGNTKTKSPPKPSTVRKDIIRLNDWYDNFLVPNGYVKIAPIILNIIIKNAQSHANPPISPKEDWLLISGYFDKYPKEINTNNSKRAEYFRQMISHFIIISYNSGTSPKELLGGIEKELVKHPKGVWNLNKIVKGGLRWCDVKIGPQEYEESKGKRFPFLEAVLYIKDSKELVQREIPTNTATYFIRWRKYCNEFRLANGLPKINEKDYIFFNPFTSSPYPYSQVSRAWGQMRLNLSHKLKGSNSEEPYTLYSLRKSYIINQINNGKNINLIKKLTGSSIGLLKRYYDRSDFRESSSE